MSEKNREAGILTLNEIRELFLSRNLEKNWSGNTTHYLINAIACTTGMRKGEIQALKWNAINDTYIDVVASWDRKYGDVRPKHNSKRHVPLLPTIHDLLISIKQTDSNDEYVF